MIVEYLSLEQARALHADQVRLYGGATGIRDKGALEAALARLAMTFGGEDLYEDLASKTAALMHSLVLNHPFVDGNTRVGAYAAILFLDLNGYECLATPGELIDMTLRVAEGKVAAEALAIWFRQRIRLAE